MLSNGELMVLQRLVAELNREQEAFIANKHTEKGEAVAPWVGAPNEDILREECLSLSMVSNSSFLFVEQKRERIVEDRRRCRRRVRECFAQLDSHIGRTMAFSSSRVSSEYYLACVSRKRSRQVYQISRDLIYAGIKFDIGYCAIWFKRKLDN